MQNTTNSLDGGVFSPMRMRLKTDRGIGIEMKKKLITAYLENMVNLVFILEVVAVGFSYCILKYSFKGNFFY